ncbi:MAPEG family protein [Roseibium aestuarii]|uniref:MAPEG family protein n=1 Tax=Roseibium aestuarii TaxID=2600299 RepID=A0ABW4JVZ7_9HYPH|nr:MAPEG family protein [Roseibium aestuarii]
MDVIITPVYAAVLALIFVVLSVRVIRMRQKLWIPIGDNGQDALLRRQRVHGNFAEYVPIALILMICAELMLTPDWLVHAMGGCLVTGRLLHAYGVSQPRENLAFRTAGMALTFLVLTAGAGINLVQAWRMADFAG